MNPWWNACWNEARDLKSVNGLELPKSDLLVVLGDSSSSKGSGANVFGTTFVVGLVGLKVVVGNVVVLYVVP